MIQTNDPDSIISDSLDELLINTFAKVDPYALGGAIGSVLGIGLFLITNLLVLRANTAVNLFFSLLNEYFWGYEITLAGSFVGLIYGFITGFLLGCFIASTRNFIVSVFLHIAKYKDRVIAVNNYIDRL